jgi:hypothetical protein
LLNIKVTENLNINKEIYIDKLQKILDSCNNERSIHETKIGMNNFYMQIYKYYTNLFIRLIIKNKI